MFSILFADDELFNLKILSEQLISKGYACDIAMDGNSAIEKIKEKKYDLILLDIGMPKKNGNQVLCETRDMGIDTPIFMLTGDIEESSKKLCLEAGANEYINKPYEIDYLLSKINELAQKNF
jgi:CheY-like chemotaxis protein